MNIGIMPNLDPSSGGLYQYSLTMLNALDSWEKTVAEDKITLFSIGPANIYHFEKIDCIKMPMEKNEKIKFTLFGILQQIMGSSLLKKFWHYFNKLNHSGFYDLNTIKKRPELEYFFKQHGIDLMIYPAPTTISFQSGIPYIMAIHDLQHRLQPQFSEVSAGGEWEYREYLFRNGARYATFILADSDVGKEDILNFYGKYGVSPEQVMVLPFIPSSYLSMNISERDKNICRIKYFLPERYLFYPAQFWPHKNHVRIIKALGLLKQTYGTNIPIIFCGSHSGHLRERTYKEVMSMARDLGIDENIKYLGYVPDEDMSALYAEAEALIMPTFFGPTNIPVLEAWAFGCPVITSDIRGIREQVGNAAILVDPKSVESISSGIYSIWTDESIRIELIYQGSQRLKRYKPEDYQRRLIEIIEAARPMVLSGIESPIK